MAWPGRWDSKVVGLEAWMSRRVLRSLGFSSQEQGACPSRLHTSRLSPAFSFQQGLCRSPVDAQPGRAMS